jgi:hypothetical protein
MVSVKEPYGRILDFLARNSYLFFEVAPQMLTLISLADSGHGVFFFYFS